MQIPELNEMIEHSQMQNQRLQDEATEFKKKFEDCEKDLEHRKK